MITAEQKLHFETFGFAIIRQLFTVDEIDLIRREGDRILAANRMGTRFSNDTLRSSAPGTSTRSTHPRNCWPVITRAFAR